MTRFVDATPLQLELHKSHMARRTMFARQPIFTSPPPPRVETKDHAALETRISDLEIAVGQLQKVLVVSQALHKRAPTMTEIINACCKHYAVEESCVLSHRLNQLLIRARQTVMYLSRMLTRHTLFEIAKVMERDPTTVLQGVRKIERLLPTDPALQADVEAIRGMLGE